MSAAPAIPITPPNRRLRYLAILAMLGSVTIFGVNFVISRHAILNGFTPYDLAALRFGFAGLILMPLFLRAGGFATCAGIGWGRGAALAFMSGVPMSMLQMIGLSLAPAAHGATIGPGMVVTISILGGAVMFGARLSAQTILGLIIALVGLGFFAVGTSSAPSKNIIIGDLCFVVMALIWGFYPLALQKWKADPLIATSVLCVLSLTYLPIYWLFLPSNLAAIPFWLILAHAFIQAVLNMIVGLWLWGWAARTIGASEAGRFPPLIPVIGTLTAIPVLAEWPGPFQTIAVVLIVAGLLVMSWKR
jgi:drug/metabolite transporter (DMT)-like permease